MTVVIRREEPRDFRRVEEVARDAFWNLYFPGGHEHAVVHQMRNHPDFIKELAYVIEVDGQVEGGIFYTRSKIIQPDGGSIDTISFGPVFIAPGFHRQGLGRQMITYTIEKAKEMGYRAILTLGYPYHYMPYGFLGGKTYGISMADGLYYKGLLVLPLYEGALDNVKGYAQFSEALEITEEAAAAFDETFPYKEKKVEPSQLEFEEACGALDH